MDQPAPDKMKVAELRAALQVMIYMVMINMVMIVMKMVVVVSTLDKMPEFGIKL